jgi:prepilin-type N-terminal cleavage/methylation domain-containing protein
MKQGFSLIELSIVLVILGLLTGGILTGQNLIRAAELRSITTQHQGYQTAAYSFRDKYFSLPGDLKNASDFWSDAVNGDGDGQLEAATTDGGDGEIYGFWEQLALAGMIEGTYSGASGSGGAGLQDSVVNVNVPAGKIGTSGWSVLYLGSVASSHSDYFEGNYGNAFFFGNKVADGMTEAAAIKPDEAWNLDIKIDDGRPDLGKVRGVENLSAADATACSNTTTAEYSLTNTAIECAVVFGGL